VASWGLPQPRQPRQPPWQSMKRLGCRNSSLWVEEEMHFNQRLCFTKGWSDAWWSDACDQMSLC
jgi:hypothetical protein